MPDALAAVQARVPGAAGPESFDRAVLIAGASGSVSATAGFSAQNGEPSHGGRTGTSSTWFAWTAPSTGKATFTTSGSSFDTAMSVYTGTALNSLIEVGSNDDSLIAGTAAIIGPMEVAAGMNYRIAVSCGSASSSCGQINFAWTLNSDVTPPPNDSHTRPTELVGATGSISATNTHSTSQNGEPAQPGGAPAMKSLWFKLGSPGMGNLSISTAGSNFDTTLSIFEGANPQSLAPVSSHDNVGTTGAKFDFTSRANFTTSRSPATYWISIDSPSQQTGTAFLSWSTTSANALTSAPAIVPIQRAAAPTSSAQPTPPSGRQAAQRSGPAPVVIEPPCSDRMPTDDLSAVLLDSPPGDYVGQGQCWLHSAPTSLISALYPTDISIETPEGSWRMQMHLLGAGATVGTFNDMDRSQFGFFGMGRGCNSLRSNVIVTRVDRDAVGQLLALDMSFEQSCDGVGPPLKGRVRYRPYVALPHPSCMTPTGTPAFQLDQRGAPNLEVPQYCNIKTADTNSFQISADANSITAIMYPNDGSVSTFVRVTGMNGLTLTTGTFPLLYSPDQSPNPTAGGIQLWGVCDESAYVSGTATITSLTRDSTGNVSSISLSYQCSLYQRIRRGIIRL
jgi:hypothetical protein